MKRSQVNAEIEDELRSHIQHRADDLERSGLSRAEAERRARVDISDPAVPAHGVAAAIADVPIYPNL